jgi:hypothetical protein
MSVQLPETGVHATHALPESTAGDEVLTDVSDALTMFEGELVALELLVQRQEAPRGAVPEGLDAPRPASRKRADDPIAFTSTVCAFAWAPSEQSPVATASERVPSNFFMYFSCCYLEACLVGDNSQGRSVWTHLERKPRLSLRSGPMEGGLPSTSHGNTGPGIEGSKGYEKEI